MTDTTKTFSQYIDSLATLAHMDTLNVSSNDNLVKQKDFDKIDWQKLEKLDSTTQPTAETDITVKRDTKLFDEINLHKFSLSHSMHEQIKALLDKQSAETTDTDTTTVKSLPQSVIDMMDNNLAKHFMSQNHGDLVKTKTQVDTIKGLNFAELLHKDDSVILDKLLNSHSVSNEAKVAQPVEPAASSAVVHSVEALKYFDGLDSQQIKVADVPAVI